MTAPVAPALPTPKPTATSKPVATATATTVPTTAPTATPTKAPTPTATAVTPAAPAPVAGAGILIAPADLARLPVSGSAWSGLKARADGALGTPNISNQDDGTDLTVLAKALVYARTGITSYRSSVVSALKSAVGTEAGGRTLALGRNLPGYVIAADLIGLRQADPAFDRDVFRPWLRSLLTKNLDGLTLVSTHERRPNNWGTHAGAARAAVAAYLGDAAELARTAQVFRGYLGDRTAYASFSFGDLTWQCDAARPVAINRAGCMKAGTPVGGAMTEEMRRSGAFSWPAKFTDYAWEGLQGALLQAELLRRAGYDSWAWSDRALYRAVWYLYEQLGWSAQGDDEWQPWLINRRYGTSFPVKAPARTGKNFGYTDWLYGS